MDYSIWKSVLLDWVNSTGFLVQNYQNLHDTDIGAFFEALKRQIRSVAIKSEDVISFLGDYYKDYLIRMDDDQTISTNEYIYIYSLFMHFACIQYPDSGIQTICKNMVQKNQEIIEKFLECLIRINKCDRLILQNAIEEAENWDTTSYKSPTSRQLQSLKLSNTSPQTPKTKMLNSWNLENRNLKAMLETERFERGYLEMQLNQCEKKLAKLDEDFKNAMTENHDLKKQVQSLDELSGDSSQITETDKAAKRFQRQLNKKEIEIERMTVSCNDARDEIESLKEQLAYANQQVKSLDAKVLESLDEIEKFKNELQKRDEMIDYMSKNNEELSELLKELQTSKRKPDFDSSTSCEMLETTAADLNSSSFYVPVEENLASSVIDIRLIDQQKLNFTLNETINQLQNELATIEAQAFKIYSSFVGKNKENDSVESPSVEKILVDVNKKYSQLNEANANLSKNIESQNVEISMFKEMKARFVKELAENTTTIDSLQKSIDSLTEKLLSIENSNKELLGAHQSILVELETTKSSLVVSETQRTELNASLDSLKEAIEKVQSERRTETARHFDELRTLKSEHKKKIEDLEINRDALIQEQTILQSNLNHIHQELDEAKDSLVAKSNECDNVTASKAALEIVFAENDAKHLAISSKLDESEKELIALRTLKENLEYDVELHETEKSKLDKQLEELRNELINQIDLVIQLKSEKEKSEKDISALKSEIHAIVETSTEEAQTFSKEITEMEASLKQSMAEVDNLEKVNETHMKTEQNLSVELKKVQEEVVAKQTEITTINSTLDKLNQNIKSLQSEIESLTQSKSVMKQENDGCILKCTSLEQALADKEQEIQNLRTDLDKRVSAFSTEGNVLNEQLTDVNNNYEEAKKRIEVLEVEKSKCLQDMVEIRSSLEEERKKVEEQLEKVRDELEISNAALDCKTEESNLLQAKYDLAQKELERTTNALEEVRFEIETITFAKSAVEESMVKLQTSHDEEQKKILEQLNNVQNELNLANAARDNKTEENNALQAKFESTQQEFEQTLDAMKEVRSEFEIISSAKSVLEVSLEELRSSYNEKQKQIKEKLEKLQFELKLANTELDYKTENQNALQAKFDSAQLELEQTVDTLNDIRSEFETVSSTNLMLEASLEKCLKRANELEKTIASNTEIEQKLSGELKLAHEEITNKQSEIETLSSDKEKLNESFKKFQEEIKSLHHSKSGVEQQLNDAQQKCVSLENEIKEKQNQMETEKSKLEAKVAKLTEAEKILRDQLAVSTREHEEAKNQIESLSQEKHKCLQEIVTVRSLYDTKCEESEREITQIKEEIQNENAQVVSLKAEQEELNKQINTLKAALEGKSAKLNSEQATKDKEIAKLESKIKEFSDETVEKANRLEQCLQKITDMETKFKIQIDELSNQKEKLSVEIQSQKDSLQKLNDQITGMSSEKADLFEKADSIEKELTEVRDELNTVNTEKNSLVSKIIQLNRTIDEQKQQLTEEKSQIEKQIANVNEQLAAIQDEKQSLEKSIEKMKVDYAKQVKSNETLKQENETIAAKVEDCAHEIEQSKVAMSNLQDENRRLIQSASKQGEVQALKEQLNQIQKQSQERADNWKKEKEALIQDNKIYRAKLMKEREIIEKKENEHRETRTEYEVKLEKMKEKMKTLYKEEMAKVKDKHEKDFNEAIAENRRCNEKIEAYELKLQKISTQIHRLNEEKLQLWKDNEMMKTKLRSVNINFQLNGNSATNMFEGGTFKMEDEEGELFDNTYLDELKGGSNKTGLPPTGRESLTLDEINRRNSMVPPHLRSSYMPQYTNPTEESKNDENLRSLDDSMFSNQSETRRLTLYKKPGPPTPSKNSARLSLGGTSDLPRGDILREQNGSDRASMGGSSTKSTAKKSTPGKFLAMFSSSKSKDEAYEKENDEHLLQKLLITSTPRCHTRRSSLPRFESTNSIRLTENSISRLRLPDWENLSQSLISKTKPSTARKIEWSIGDDATSPDSTPTQNTSKVIPAKKSTRRRRSSVVAKKSIRLNWRKEKRQAIYNQTRRISKVEHVIDEYANRTFSITGSSKSAGTVPSSGLQSIETNFGSELEEIEIRNFHAEVNQHKGPLEISTENLNVIDSLEEQYNFEKLCNSKKSHCPFDGTKNKAEKSLLKECIEKIIGQKSSDDGQYLAPPAQQRSSSGIAARISSHCARICWNQQRIPQVHTYKVEKRTDTSVKNSSSVSSTHSSFLNSVEALHTSISDGWNELPTFVQYYIIAITLCLISIIYFRINK